MISPPIVPAPSPDIKVMRATANDWPALAEYYAREFGDRPRLNDARLWHWKFLEQPGDARHVPFFVLKVDGRIEGAIGYLQFDLCVGDASVAAIHQVNYFVNARYKGLPALRLFRATLQEGQIAIGANASDDARRLFTKSGFVDLAAHVHSYHLGLGMMPRTNLRSRVIWAGRRVWESILCGYFRTMRHALTYRIDHELDDALLEIAGAWPPGGIGIRKTAAHLRWRYAHSPVLNCRYVWQFDNGIPVSLAVAHFDERERTAVLLDVTAATFESDRCTGIILETIRHARANAMGMLVTHCMSPVVEPVLRRVGFGHVPSDLGFLVYSPDSEDKGTLANARRWHFMLGDTDRY